MKALTVKQPWASLIASGQKTIETRTWATNYRGDLLIVSAARPKIEPAGFAVAVVSLVDCRPMTKEDETAACTPVYPKAHAWIFANTRKIAPFPARGARRVYDVPVREDQLLKENRCGGFESPHPLHQVD